MRLGGVGVLGSVLLVSGRQAFGQSAHEVALSADKLELHNVKAQGRAIRDARLFVGIAFRVSGDTAQFQFDRAILKWRPGNNRGRPVATKPFHAIHLGAGIPVEQIAGGKSREV